MRSKLWIQLAALVLASCGSGPSPGAGQQASRLRVFQEQQTCCYVEGQVSFLDVGGIEHRIDPIGLGVTPLIDLEVEAGQVEVESWQRPCDGNCGYLDPPTNQCTTTIEAPAGGTVILLVSFEPGPDPCEMTILDQDPATGVPIEYGFRTQLPSCGEDFTMQEAMYGDVSHESEVRHCFLAAHLGGDPAEMTAYVPNDPDSGNDNLLDLYTYRTQPDAPVEVFVNLGPDFVEWQAYTCDSLIEVDGPELFQLEGCSDPQPAV